MVAITDKLTIADFERLYGEAKPRREYWFGEAIPKAMPAWLHGLVQKIIMVLLDEADYRSASEVKAVGTGRGDRSEGREAWLWTGKLRR